MSRVLIELEFDQDEVTEADVREYLQELLDDDNVSFELIKE